MAEGISYICEVNETRNQLLARKTVHDIYNIWYGAFYANPADKSLKYNYDPLILDCFISLYLLVEGRN